MNGKHDFHAINRVMRSHRLVAGSSIPLLRGMHLDPGSPPSAVLEDLKADDLIEINADTKATLVKDEAALGKFVGRVQHFAQQAKKTVGEQREYIVKMADDLKAAKESAAEAITAAKRAEAIAKDQARLVPDGGGASLEALKSIPQAHEVDPEYVGKMSRGHFNLKMLSRRELDLLPPAVKSDIERFNALDDALALVDAYMMGRGPARVQAYQRAGGVKGLKLWKTYEPLMKKLAAAMDTAEAGAGAEWDPTGVGISVIEDIRPEFELSSYIPTVPMPRSPYLYPVQGGHFKTYKASEGTANDLSTGAIGKRDLATLNLTFTAVKQAAMLLCSSELVEDSIVPLIAAIRADMALAVIAGEEDADLNGQLGVSFDTAETIAADDPRNFWKGLRYFASLTGASYDFSSGLVVSGLTNLLGQMGKYGKSRFGVWATGYIGWAKMLTLKDDTNALVLTADRVGTTSALQSGTLGMLLGAPLAVCDDYPQAMGASGAIDGSGTDRTGLIRFDRRAFRRGVVRLARIEYSEHWAFETDQPAFKVTYRSHMQPVRTPSSTYKVVGQGVGLPVA